ncbi:hypothetical protein DL96DRAFT_1809735 [Flagelloscypha sp. PMI_526]|nr:hypothetical protein DL96DRAFT_1809735 [Flagelloscypha sp. PMI_526]
MSSTIQEHQYGEGYSGDNKVPTIAKFQEHQERLHSENTPLPSPPPSASSSSASSSRASSLDLKNKSLPAMPVEDDDEPPARDAQKSGKQQKQEMMNRLQPPKGTKATDKAKSKGQYWARDPVTDEDVLLKDLTFKDFRAKGFNNASLDPESYTKGPALREPPEPSKQSFKYTAPTVEDVGNISLASFPPAIDKVDVNHALSILRTGAIAVSAGCAVAWYFVAGGKHVSWFGFFFRTCLLGCVAAMAWIGAENARRKIEKELERIRMNLHEKRAEAFSPPTPESVEWMNALLKLVWGIIPDTMFIPIIDQIEDVLQASLPGFVNAVRISDLGQGTNPVRVVHMRALPDKPGTRGYPREEWVGLDKETQAKIKAEKGITGETDTDTNESEPKDPNAPISPADDDQSGDYLNYEIALSYQAQPGQSKKLRFHNIHLMLEFFLGAFDWFKLPVPFFAIVEGFVATARLRIQFIQNPPFIRNVTISLMGVPKVEVSVEPFSTKLPNVLDLPLIQKFVEMGIAAACAEYVAPKSLTLNMAQMLAGDGIKKDTRALGIIVVNIRYAVGLSAQDSNGASDPYIVLSYAKFGKPIYSTRIVLGDLNPVWEETAFLLVTDEEVKAREDLAATLWDSDKRTADDLVGRVTIPLVEVMSKPNEMHAREDRLQGFEDANEMPGTLHWEIGYYDKMPFNQSLALDAKEKKAQATEEAPGPVAQVEERENIEENKPTIADTKVERDALNVPPDPEVPMGILSVIVHQINNLERQDIKGSTGDREGQAGQDTSEPAEEGPNLPNGYCEIILNDEMIYKTRVKQYTSMPYFEAGTERFVRDWTKTVVRVQVRDARTREKDPVLGIVTVNLKDLFTTSSQVTRLFALQEGIGYGRANISFLIRQVKMPIPRELLGWDTGTVSILGPITMTPVESSGADLNVKKLRISTTEQSFKAPSRASPMEGGGLNWDIPTDKKVRLPVYARYASACLFEMSSSGGINVFSSPDMVAALWLRDIPDGVSQEIKIPVIKSNRLKQLRQNYINDQTATTHEYDIVGYLTCKLMIEAGLDPDHESHQHTREDKHRFEAYTRVEGQARTAEKNSHAMDDGVLDRKEKRALAAEKTRQLHMRHRGIMQYQAARTGLWAKEGVQRRFTTLRHKVTGSGSHSRRPTVESEA